MCPRSKRGETRDGGDKGQGRQIQRAVITNDDDNGDGDEDEVVSSYVSSNPFDDCIGAHRTVMV